MKTKKLEKKEKKKDKKENEKKANNKVSSYQKAPEIKEGACYCECFQCDTGSHCKKRSNGCMVTY